MAFSFSLPRSQTSRTRKMWRPPFISGYPCQGWLEDYDIAQLMENYCTARRTYSPQSSEQEFEKELTHYPRDDGACSTGILKCDSVQSIASCMQPQNQPDCHKKARQCAFLIRIFMFATSDNSAHQTSALRYPFSIYFSLFFFLFSSSICSRTQDASNQ
jgi:hypothetical protein